MKVIEVIRDDTDQPVKRWVVRDPDPDAELQRTQDSLVPGYSARLVDDAS